MTAHRNWDPLEYGRHRRWVQPLIDGDCHCYGSKRRGINIITIIMKDQNLKRLLASKC